MKSSKTYPRASLEELLQYLIYEFLHYITCLDIVKGIFVLLLKFPSSQADILYGNNAHNL